jgi:hypothetical protein
MPVGALLSSSYLAARPPERGIRKQRLPNSGSGSRIADQPLGWHVSQSRNTVLPDLWEVRAQSR